jgi:hypothetical protein
MHTIKKSTTYELFCKLLIAANENTKSMFTTENIPITVTVRPKA